MEEYSHWQRNHNLFIKWIPIFTVMNDVLANKIIINKTLYILG